jgi:hypothetical protein
MVGLSSGGGVVDRRVVVPSLSAGGWDGSRDPCADASGLFASHAQSDFSGVTLRACHHLYLHDIVCALLLTASDFHDCPKP